MDNQVESLTKGVEEIVKHAIDNISTIIEDNEAAAAEHVKDLIKVWVYEVNVC